MFKRQIPTYFVVLGQLQRTEETFDFIVDSRYITLEGLNRNLFTEQQIEKLSIGIITGDNN